MTKTIFSNSAVRGWESEHEPLIDAMLDPLLHDAPFVYLIGESCLSFG